MRWYIKDYSTEKLSSMISKIDASVVSKKQSESICLVSPDEGTYVIQNDSVHRLHYDSKFTHFFFNDVQLICQHSDPIKEDISSRIPVRYTCFANNTVKYALNGDPLILLCVEYHDKSISDFYFEVKVYAKDKKLIELINDSKTEINGFLSILN
jgi:hypothetical protein